MGVIHYIANLIGEKEVFKHDMGLNHEGSFLISILSPDFSMQNSEKMRKENMKTLCLNDKPAAQSYCADIFNDFFSTFYISTYATFCVLNHG